MRDHVCQDNDGEFMQAHVVKHLALSKARESAEYRAARELALRAIKEGMEKGELSAGVSIDNASRAVMEAVAEELNGAGYHVNIWEQATIYRAMRRLEISWREANGIGLFRRTVHPDEMFQGEDLK